MSSPLSSIEISSQAGESLVSTEVSTQTSYSVVRPLALRALRPAPAAEIPSHVYDPVRQIVTDVGGRPLAPNLAKEWTSLGGTHTDGDGGDNETWDWEEV